MAWIIGQMNKKERQRILESGYEIDEILTPERSEQVFGSPVEVDEEDENTEDNKMVMMFVDCDVTDLLCMID